jgi:hypothetical protein
MADEVQNSNQNPPAATPEEAAKLQHKADSGATADKKLEKAVAANEAAGRKELEKKTEVKVIPSDADANRAPETNNIKTEVDKLGEGPRTEEFVKEDAGGKELTEAQEKERDEALALKLRLPNHANRDPKGSE